MSREDGGEPTHRHAGEPERAELEALLARCAAGEAPALEALYTRVAPLLLAVLMRILRRRDLAEDVLQDVFVKVWQQASQFDPIRGRPLAWLVSMARYRAIDLQRAARPLLTLSEPTVSHEPQLQVGGPGESSEVLGGGQLLRRCLEQIAPPQRRCLVLAYEEGLTHSEIARAVGEPLGTVKSWVRRSLLALRRCLGS
jgi:RNA polymerase sigma-70 factor, ECF subfamily